MGVHDGRGVVGVMLCEGLAEGTSEPGQALLGDLCGARKRHGEQPHARGEVRRANAGGMGRIAIEGGHVHGPPRVGERVG